jgi:mRNA-degrading endonuclease RelE of RelBE toxin-antitoxin system
MSFKIDYSPLARRQLRDLDAGPRKRLLDAIERRLVHEPTKEDRNRFKRRHPNPLSEWELREVPLRAFYDVDLERGMVYVQAIGIKRGERTYDPSGPEMKTND